MNECLDVDVLDECLGAEEKRINQSFLLLRNSLNSTSDLVSFQYIICLHPDPIDPHVDPVDLHELDPDQVDPHGLDPDHVVLNRLDLNPVGLHASIDPWTKSKSVRFSWARSRSCRSALTGSKSYRSEWAGSGSCRFACAGSQSCSSALTVVRGS